MQTRWTGDLFPAAMFSALNRAPGQWATRRAAPISSNHLGASKRIFLFRRSTSAAEDRWKGHLESALGVACAVTPGGSDVASPPETNRDIRGRLSRATLLGSCSRQSSSRIQGGSRHHQG